MLTYCFNRCFNTNPYSIFQFHHLHTIFCSPRVFIKYSLWAIGKEKNITTFPSLCPNTYLHFSAFQSWPKWIHFPLFVTIPSILFDIWPFNLKFIFRIFLYSYIFVIIILRYSQKPIEFINYILLHSCHNPQWKEYPLLRVVRRVICTWGAQPSVQHITGLVESIIFGFRLLALESHFSYLTLEKLHPLCYL